MSAEELLKKLLEKFFSVANSKYDLHKGLVSSYVEDITINHILGKEFELQLLPYLNEDKNQELIKVHETLE